MQTLRSETIEEDLNISTPGSRNKNKDKNAKRMLKARRAVEEYFEEKRLGSLSGKEYWEALC